VTENVTEALKWLPRYFLDHDEKDMLKIILYVRSINTCQQVFNWMLDELGDKVFLWGEDCRQ
jgi:hypothetical protein